MDKWKCIFFSSFLLIPLLARPQGFEASILVAANFSQIDGDQFAGYNKLGLNIGMGISRKIDEHWKWSFEILYSQKGSKKVIDPDVPAPTLRIDYHYAEVPFLAKYRLKSAEVYGGPGIGLNVFNQRDDNGFKSAEPGLLRTEVSFHLGGTYYVGEHFGFELRHSYSLLSVRNQKFVAISPTWFGRAGWYNRLFTVGVRYNFGS